MKDSQLKKGDSVHIKGYRKGSIGRIIESGPEVSEVLLNGAKSFVPNDQLERKDK